MKKIGKTSVDTKQRHWHELTITSGQDGFTISTMGCINHVHKIKNMEVQKVLEHDHDIRYIREVK